MTSVCPFAGLGGSRSECPVDDNKEQSSNHAGSPKCPLGYDSGSFKLGPFSCVICRALLFNAARCLPCRHVFCRACISRFNDCPLCGVDITGFEDEMELQGLVDQFIQGHARITRPLPDEDTRQEQGQVAYEDASLARGSFLIQHAMRAFQAQNLESAKARLDLCVEDTREMLARKGACAEICSQLGAVLGLLGDCLRSMGESDDAMLRYNESVKTLQKIDNKDSEIVHALSVSLNKLGDMKYYAEDLQSAHALYKQALEVRQNALKDSKALSAENIDIVVSLAKVADVERAMGKEAGAAEGFVQAVKTLEGLSSPSKSELLLEKRRLSVLEFLHSQITTANSSRPRENAV